MAALQNFEVTGEVPGTYGGSVNISYLPLCSLSNIICTAVQDKQTPHGAIRVDHAIADATNVTVSNKKIAFDVMAGTLYLNKTDTGENNEVAIRCGNAWGSFGGFVQKGGAAIAGTEQTAYGGQIF